jgi:Na+-transporting NADH:ubiquinone oxidoreductase subunit C
MILLLKFSEGKNAMSLREKSSIKTVLFVITLCFFCAFSLSVLQTLLLPKQIQAKNISRYKQLLIASKALSNNGYFLITEDTCKYTYANYNKKLNKLQKTKTPIKASDDEIEIVYRKRIRPFLVDNNGNQYSFEKLNINFSNYLEKYKTDGYSKQKYKLIYKIFPNTDCSESDCVEGYVIPINGQGLWDKIYGYLAIESDGNTIIGASWYEQNETAGLGANITKSSWLDQFCEKQIFQQANNLVKARLGIIIAKGKMKKVCNNPDLIKNCVDGITGATITSNAVSDAYKKCLNEYRSFLIIANTKFIKQKSYE